MRTFRAAVIDRSGRVAMRGDGGRFHLPEYVPEPLTWFGGEHANGPVGRQIGQEVVSLDCFYRRVEGEARHVISGFELTEEPALLDGWTWVEAGRLEEATLAPDERESLMRWLDEVSSGMYPDLRVEWAKPGWYATAAAWLAREMAALGRPVTGRMEQNNSSSISSVIRAPTASGGVYFKAVPPLFAAEAAVTALLRRRAGSAVSEPILTDQERRWMVTADIGGDALDSLGLEACTVALREFGRLQRATVEWVGELREAGLAWKPLGWLHGEIAGILTDPWVVEGIDAEERSRLAGLIPGLERDCEVLMGLGLPDTLVHGDLHTGNIRMVEEAPVFFDWTDACIGHPFMDLAAFLHGNSLPGGSESRAALLGAYGDAWSGLLSGEELRRAMELAPPLAIVFELLSYRYIMRHTEPARRWQFNGLAFWARELLGAGVVE